MGFFDRSKAERKAEYARREQERKATLKRRLDRIHGMDADPIPEGAFRWDSDEAKATIRKAVTEHDLSVITRFGTLGGVRGLVLGDGGSVDVTLHMVTHRPARLLVDRVYEAPITPDAEVEVVGTATGVRVTYTSAGRSLSFKTTIELARQIELMIASILEVKAEATPGSVG